MSISDRIFVLVISWCAAIKHLLHYAHYHEFASRSSHSSPVWLWSSRGESSPLCDLIQQCENYVRKLVSKVALTQLRLAPRARCACLCVCVFTCVCTCVCVQLAYCCVQFMEKDSTLSEPVSHFFSAFWFAGRKSAEGCWDTIDEGRCIFSLLSTCVAAMQPVAKPCMPRCYICTPIYLNWPSCS